MLVTDNKVQPQADTAYQMKGNIVALLSAIVFGLFGYVLEMPYRESNFTSLEAMFDQIFLAPSVILLCVSFFCMIILYFYNVYLGKQKEIIRHLTCKPGRSILLGTFLGGPIGFFLYILALYYSGPALAIPISATCPVFGAILAKIMYKQKLLPRVMVGIIISVLGVIVISQVNEMGDTRNIPLGIMLAVLTALFWGLEGAVCSFGGSLLDSSINSFTRQLVTFVTTLVFILVVAVNQSEIDIFGFIVDTLKNHYILMIYIFGGVLLTFETLLWYNAITMVGAAKAFAINSTYVFWGIGFTWLFDSIQITSFLIVGTIMLFAGAILTTVNAFKLFKE